MLRKMEIALTIMLLIVSILCTAESSNISSPVINLSNLGCGEWIATNSDENADIVSVKTENFYMDDVEETLERMYVFTFDGINQGHAVIIIEYRREKEVIVELCVELTVDANLNVQIEEVTVLPGLYEGTVKFFL